MFGPGTDDDALLEWTLIAAFAHITEFTAPRSDLVARIHILLEHSISAIRGPLAAPSIVAATSQ